MKNKSNLGYAIGMVEGLLVLAQSEGQIVQNETLKKLTVKLLEALRIELKDDPKN
jgi:hypothetical protein